MKIGLYIAPLAPIFIFIMSGCIDIEEVVDEEEITEHSELKKENKELTDKEIFEVDIIGTWVSPCRNVSAENNNFLTSISTWVVTEEKITNSGIEFGDNDCMTDVGTWGPVKVEYEVGDEVIAGDGLSAWELDVISPNKTTYLLARIVNNGTLELHVSDKGDTADSPEERPGEFTGNNYWRRRVQGECGSCWMFSK